MGEKDFPPVQRRDHPGGRNAKVNHANPPGLKAGLRRVYVKKPLIIGL
jgi:hypothetical protein